MRRLWIVLAIATMMSLGASAQEESPIDRGELLYRSFCAGCHGETGRGDGPTARRLRRDFKVVPLDLTVLNKDPQQLSDAIKGARRAHAKSFMPVWGATLTEQQIEDLVVFIQVLRNEAPRRAQGSIAGPIEELEKGHELYSSHCLACHGPRGQGDGPYMGGKRTADLSNPEYARQKTDSELARWVRSGLMHSGSDIERPSWWHRKLEDAEVWALVRYLRMLPLLNR